MIKLFMKAKNRIIFLLKYKTIKPIKIINNEKICVSSSKGNYLINRRCPHQGAFLERAYLNDNILTAQLPESELKELLAILLDQSSPHSMSFEDLPVEETMKSFFQNPQNYL